MYIKQVLEMQISFHTRELFVLLVQAKNKG